MVVDLALVDSLVVDADNDVDSCQADKALDLAIEDKLGLLVRTELPEAGSLDLVVKLVALPLQPLPSLAE